MLINLAHTFALRFYQLSLDSVCYTSSSVHVYLLCLHLCVSVYCVCACSFHLLCLRIFSMMQTTSQRLSSDNAYSKARIHTHNQRITWYERQLLEKENTLSQSDGIRKLCVFVFFFLMMRFGAEKNEKKNKRHIELQWIHFQRKSRNAGSCCNDEIVAKEKQKQKCDEQCKRNWYFVCQW